MDENSCPKRACVSSLQELKARVRFRTDFSPKVCEHLPDSAFIFSATKWRMKAIAFLRNRLQLSHKNRRPWCQIIELIIILILTHGALEENMMNSDQLKLPPTLQYAQTKYSNCHIIILSSKYLPHDQTHPQMYSSSCNIRFASMNFSFRSESFFAIAILHLEPPSSSCLSPR